MARKKETITVRRASDGDVKTVLKSEIKKYVSAGYRVEWTPTIEVEAKVKPVKKKKDDTKEEGSTKDS